MVKVDSILDRILAYDRQNGGGIAVRKVGPGYSLFEQDNGRPVARLKPMGDGDRVEVMWWSHRNKWEQIGGMGRMVMPLDEALNFIARDPCGCFWH